jgi:hypothetical protein
MGLKHIFISHAAADAEIASQLAQHLLMGSLSSCAVTILSEDSESVLGKYFNISSKSGDFDCSIDFTIGSGTVCLHRNAVVTKVLLKKRWFLLFNFCRNGQIANEAIKHKSHLSIIINNQVGRNTP